MASPPGPRSDLYAGRPIALASSLRLSDTARQRLRIKTIGACDVTKAERERLRRERWNAKRSNQTRDSYLAANTASRAKPWEAEGISRAKWYRLGRHLETSPRQHKSIPMSAPTCLTPRSMAAPTTLARSALGLAQSTTGIDQPARMGGSRAADGSVESCACPPRSFRCSRVKVRAAQPRGCATQAAKPNYSNPARVTYS